MKKVCIRREFSQPYLLTSREENCFIKEKRCLSQLELKKNHESSSMLFSFVFKLVVTLLKIGTDHLIFFLK
jgi:hypothetical protein